MAAGAEGQDGELDASCQGRKEGTCLSVRPLSPGLRWDWSLSLAYGSWLGYLSQHHPLSGTKADRGKGQRGSAGFAF